VTRSKDFGKGAKQSDFEPLSFTLAGKTFKCNPAMQGKFLLDMAASTDASNPASGATAVNKFFERALKPGEFEKFDALLNDPDIIITSETLGEILSWLVEEYAERPTEEPTP
jgi:hypothetical protein